MKEKYKEFCAHTEGVTIFMQPWFLDAVCYAGEWNVCMDIAKNGEVNGVLVYYMVKKWGFSLLKMPPLIPYMPLWIKDDTTWKQEHRLSFQKTTLKQLIEQLPQTTFSLQMYPASLTNWLPFWWAGYRIEPMTNYVLDNLNDTPSVWQGLKDTTRNKIRKAQKNKLIVSDDINLDEFYNEYEKTVKRIGYKTALNKNILEEIHVEIKRQGKGKIYAVKDELGNIHAALYVIWHGETAIYWIATMSDKSNGAMSLLLWHVLQELGQKGISRFEATGSMQQNLESFMATFGGHQENYWKLTRYKNRFIALVHTLIKTYEPKW